MRKTVQIFIALGILSFLVLMIANVRKPKKDATDDTRSDSSALLMDQKESASAVEEKVDHPMSVEVLRQREYEGGDFVIAETLPNGTNYQQSIVSYESEGLKIYGLLTVPLTQKPKNGYPAVLFVHGYIPPKKYSTTGSYPSYQATLARSGFVTFKPDLRGHGKSEGEPVSAHFSEKYVVDTMYALSSLKRSKEVDPNRIGYWGHSNGGEIGLRIAVITTDIKAFSFWAGVVGSYRDMFETYNDRIPFLRQVSDSELVRNNGLPSSNPPFWDKLDPYSYLSDITASIQIQHATGDESVPIVLSQRLKEELEKAGKSAQYFEYIGDDHNIGANSSLAWKRSIEFLRKNLE